MGKTCPNVNPFLAHLLSVQQIWDVTSCATDCICLSNVFICKHKYELKFNYCSYSVNNCQHAQSGFDIQINRKHCEYMYNHDH